MSLVGEIAVTKKSEIAAAFAKLPLKVISDRIRIIYRSAILGKNDLPSRSSKTRQYIARERK